MITTNLVYPKVRVTLSANLRMYYVPGIVLLWFPLEFLIFGDIRNAQLMALIIAHV